MDTQEQKKLSPEIEDAMRFWSAQLKAMMDQKYGADKVGHIIIVFPYGDTVKPSWISTARRESVVMMLRHLADHIEDPDARIIRTH